jgi:hypothetical protein
MLLLILAGVEMSHRESTVNPLCSAAAGKLDAKKPLQQAECRDLTKELPA